MNQRSQPLPYRMTGSLAVVSLAVNPAHEGDTGGRGVMHRSGSHGDHWQPSRYSLAETLHRLEARAGEHGLHVLLRWVADDGATAPEWPGRLVSVPCALRCALLVFEPLGGTGTPVSLAPGEASAELPLSLRLRIRDDGRTEVCLPSSLPSLDRRALPPEAALAIDELPALVADALG